MKDAISPTLRQAPPSTRNSTRKAGKQLQKCLVKMRSLEITLSLHNLASRAKGGRGIKCWQTLTKGGRVLSQMLTTGDGELGGLNQGVGRKGPPNLWEVTNANDFTLKWFFLNLLARNFFATFYQRPAPQVPSCQVRICPFHSHYLSCARTKVNPVVTLVTRGEVLQHKDTLSFSHFHSVITWELRKLICQNTLYFIFIYAKWLVKFSQK